MSLKIVSFPLYLLLCCSLLLHFVVANPNGFTLKLIHRDSIESPLFPGNHTVIERLHRMHNQTKHRLYHISSLIKPDTTVEIPNATVQSKVYWDSDNILYLAHICIGNIWDGLAGKFVCNNYFLGVDTSSNEIWTQCEGCNNCFKQKYPYFRYYKSRTYHSLPCNQHPLCTPNMCRGVYCGYTESYVGGTSSAGVLATEQIFFQSDTAFHEVINNVVFGCGSDQKNWDVESNFMMSGVLGLGRGPRSLLNQLGDRANGQFSYCLQQPAEGADSITTLLQFGNDAKFQSGARVKSTPFKVYRDRNLYYVKLLDISVGDRKLNFRPRTFDLKVDGTGGCIIEPSSSITSMYERDYDVVRAAVREYFATRHELDIIEFEFLDLCYQGNLEGIQFPTITLHFEHSDLVVGKYAFLMVNKDTFCLGIESEKDAHVPMLVGNNFQTNYRFLYDIPHETLSFAEEDCNHAH